MILLEPAQRSIVEDILRRFFPGRTVLAFGSRVNGRPKPFSDIDLCVMGDEPVSLSSMADAKDAFTESDLPFRVDLIDWATTSPSFRAIVLRGGEQLI